MTKTDGEADTETPDEPILLAEFLESVPPATFRTVSDLIYYDNQGHPKFHTPDLQLHCGSESCGGTRFFHATSDVIHFGVKSQEVFLRYQCRNCKRTLKIFPLFAHKEESGRGGTVLKLGEWPVFGPPTPARLVSLVGADRDAFLKGRRAENQGLGVGAFAYYRRVVENQKNRILDEIIRVAEKTNAKGDVLETLKAAKAETQFSKAVEMVRNAIPESLLVGGHNPLILLHSALSEGLHAQSDEDCLALATSIRVVLQELSERAAIALKDHAELTSAVSRLMQRKQS